MRRTGVPEPPADDHRRRPRLFPPRQTLCTSTSRLWRWPPRDSSARPRPTSACRPFRTGSPRWRSSFGSRSGVPRRHIHVTYVYGVLGAREETLMCMLAPRGEVRLGAREKARNNREVPGSVSQRCRSLCRVGYLAVFGAPAACLFTFPFDRPPPPPASLSCRRRGGKHGTSRCSRRRPPSAPGDDLTPDTRTTSRRPLPRCVRRTFPHAVG